MAANAQTDPSGLVAGIFLGDSSRVPSEPRALFADAGQAHLLSTNGLKCWSVALLFGAVANLALFGVSGLLRSRLQLKLRRLAQPLGCLGGTWLYWLWSDQSVAITRCAAMVSAKFTLDALEVRVQYWRLLLVFYLLSLTVAPRLGDSASFQLTYGCIFGILLVPRLVARFRPSRGLLTPLWDYFWTTTGAVLGMTPTTWLVFGELNFMSVLTSWFAVPLVSFFLLPLGLAQMLLCMPLGLEHAIGTEWLTHGVGVVNAWGAGFLAQTLRWWVALMPTIRI